MITKLSRSVRSCLAAAASSAFCLSMSALGDVVKLQWSATPDSSVTQYRVYSSPNPTSTFSPALTTSEVEAAITNSSSLVGYRFYVTALNAQGVESDPSSYVEVGPRLTYARVNAGRYSLSWSGSGFVLQSAPTVKGPWTPRASRSPATIDPTGLVEFFRLVRN